MISSKFSTSLQLHEKKPRTHSEVNPHFSTFFQCKATTNLLSLCIDLLILDILYKRNHTICGVLGLASFTSHFQGSSTL